jgi:hypothetical protein
MPRNFGESPTTNTDTPPATPHTEVEQSLQVMPSFEEMKNLSAGELALWSRNCRNLITKKLESRGLTIIVTKRAEFEKLDEEITSEAKSISGRGGDIVKKTIKDLEKEIKFFNDLNKGLGELSQSFIKLLNTQGTGAPRDAQGKIIEPTPVGRAKIIAEVGREAYGAEQKLKRLQTALKIHPGNNKDIPPPITSSLH